MMLAAEPFDLAGAIIVGVMGLGPLGTTDLARLRGKEADAFGGLGVEMGQVAAGVPPPPFLLSGEGLCHGAIIPSISLIAASTPPQFGHVTIVVSSRTPPFHKVI